MHDRWEIDQSDLKILKKLGAGQFGEVWEGTFKENTPVAIKSMKGGKYHMWSISTSITVVVLYFENIDNTLKMH